jgi:hypothetical protein
MLEPGTLTAGRLEIEQLARLGGMGGARAGAGARAPW